MNLVESRKDNFINFFFVVTILLVHFDPIGLKITLPFFFLLILVFQFKASNQMIWAFLLSSFFLIVVFTNLILFNDFNHINFLKTLALLLFSIFYHIFFSSCSNLNKVEIHYRTFNITLFILILISLLQFIFFKYFNSTFFFNLFGKYSYTNQYDLELLNDGPLRITAFYLEPSYFALVLIHLFLFFLLLNKVNILNILSIIFLLILAGSRGGFLFFLLFLFHFIIFTEVFALRIKFFLSFIFLIFLGFVLLSSDSFSILLLDNISAENTSQFQRIFLGFKFSEMVLKNYPTGIVLGQIEHYFVLFFGEKGSLFSFFYLVIAYFGYFGLFGLFLFYFYIYFKFSFKNFLFLLIYSLMYFNLSGSLLAPDTYFWFCIFVLIFRKKLYEKEI